MKVGLGSTVWAQGMHGNHLDGIGHYSQELCGQIIQSKKDIELRPATFGHTGVTHMNGLKIKCLPRYSSSVLWSALSGFDFLKTQSFQQEIDLFHATDHLTPRLTRIPVVATLMDAIPISHPQWVNKFGRGLKNRLWRKSAQWANHVITISEFSKKEISHHFEIDEQKISVIPLGVDARYFDRLSLDIISNYGLTLGLPERFFLCIGTLQPRKNIERIIDAHEALPAKMRHDFPLLIVGRNGWGSAELINRLNAYGKGGAVHWLQNVDDVAKRVLLQKATALVFPSLLEGFGLPVLEAFASQTPVITSNLSSLPEVAGDAAWLVDPYNMNDIAEAMATLAREESVAQVFVSNGLSRARAFTWHACALETIKVYEQVLN